MRFHMRVRIQGNFAGLAIALGAMTVTAAALLVACGGTATTTTDATASGGDGGTSIAIDGSAVGEACPDCTTDQDCANGARCMQLGGDTYCAAPCASGTTCSSDQTCVSANSATGDQVAVCVPRATGCGDMSGSDDAGAPSTNTCGSLVGPDVAAGCTSCTGKSNCQTNGCFGGWWCNTSSNKCQAAPSGCTSGDSGISIDAGAPPVGTVGASGGTVSRLLFAVVGDTRPAAIQDTAGYPSAIIDRIYTDVEAFSPHPSFVINTGDYMFASPYGSEAGPQLDLYLKARAKYSGPIFPAMGNHECTGSTTSNCGNNNKDGITNNYTAFISKLLSPIQKTDPYYEIRVDATDGSWTSKFVFVAANAWDSAQSAWLDTTLARATTYTFVVRHESHSANTAPGVTPSETIMAKHPYTLAIVGHTHTYEHFNGREVIIGNGGAPLTGSKNYGFGLFSQRSDGSIQVDMVDYQSGATDGQFRFAVHADGSSAP